MAASASSDSAPLVVVLGATGFVGTATVHALSASGVSVRAGVRNAESDKAKALAALPNVAVVTADMSKPDTLPAAVSGATSVFVVTPGSDQRTSLTLAAVKAAEAEGAHSLVISVPSVAEPESVFGAQLIPVEDALSKLSSPYTILRAPLFMDNNWGNVSSIKGDGKLYGANSPDKAFIAVSVQDIGEAAAKILSSPADHAGKTYTLSATPYTNAELAAAFTKHTGREVSYVQVPYEGAKGAMMGMGIPEWQADGIVELLVQIEDQKPHMTLKTDDFESIVGRPAVDIDAWVAGVAAAFTPEAEA